MRSWMGAIAAAAAIAVLPSAAHADDGSSLVQFKLPDKATVDQIAAQGADLDHGVIPVEGGVLVSVQVTPQEQAALEAQGYPAVAVISDAGNADRLRAQRNATLEAEAAAKAALERSPAKGKNAAASTVRAQRADYFENYAGRYISIEATTSQAAIANNRYSGPQLTAAWLDASGAELGSGNLSALLDPDVSPAQYLYHVSVYRVGNLNDGGTMPASVKIAAPNGDVDTLAVKEWVSKNGASSPVGFVQDFVTHYPDPQEAYKKMRDLATEFPNIAQVYDLPNKSPGYQRKAQAIVGTSTPYAGGTSSLATAAANQAVVLTTGAWGHQGGNDVTVELRNPGGNSLPLGVTVNGKAITVSLATSDTGAVTSTAAQVVAAINALPEATALATAAKYRTNAGAGVVAPTAITKLSDFLKAPESYPRGPQTVQMLRIGTHRDGSKVGVFLYCQEHAREWGTPVVCMETAERIVRNYATDPETKALVDNLDIFIIPSVNADGSAYSLYDFNSQRRNMVNYCASNPTGNNDPAARNSWGVDLNRNFSVGTIFDGYVGASNSCTSDTFAGPMEFSEPETRNEQWVQNTFSNIKFANNIHSSGGYFMWPPGAYKPDRTTLPYPPYGTLNYFDQTAASVLDRIKSYRGTAILPQQTGPVTDVLYSAAGNSADEAYYNHGIIGYDFEIGAARTLPNGSSVGPGFQPPFGPATGTTGSSQLAYEGHDEGMEFSNGNFALLKSALEYSNDTAPPVVNTVSKLNILPNGATYDVKFVSNEASSIYYTTDGSTPTTASTEWKPTRARALPLPLDLPAGTTLKWISVDFKGNTSAVKSEWLTPHVDTPGTVGGSVGSTLSLTLGAAAQFGDFTPGSTKTYLASTTANVVSTAGDALLSVADPSSVGTGHLVNGAFVLPQPLQARARNTASTGTAYNSVGSSASPLNLLTYAAPMSNDAVSLEFSQLVNSVDPLRTGTYSKALTFTLSTTTP